MAHYSNALSFLLVIVLFFSRQIEARESKFFTKAIIHYLNTNATTNNATASSHVEPPSPSPSEAPTPIESENGYGLYGQGATKLPNTFDNGESDIPTEKFKEESNKEYLNNNNGYPNNYNEHAYVTVPQGLSGTKFMENGKYVYDPKFAPTTGIPNQVPEENLYNNVYPNNYNENAYVTVPQDTTFMEDGKYYYEPKNERKYEAVKESSGNNNEGYYGNNNGEKSKYEFDSMEEYERQEGYPQTDQGEYVP